jgi:excisionase family DNA binding protein
MTETMLKPREVSEWLGIHVNTVKRMSDRGELPYFRVGLRGDRRYRPADVRAYIERRSEQGGKRTSAARDDREDGHVAEG